MKAAGAALAFFTVFSVAPVVIIAVSIVGLVLGESAAHGEIVRQLESAIGLEAAAAVFAVTAWVTLFGMWGGAAFAD